MVVCAYANDRKVVPIHPFHGTYPFNASQERSYYNGYIIVFIPRYFTFSSKNLVHSILFLIFALKLCQ